MKEKVKSFTIRIEEKLFNEMDEYKEKNGINWSAKIRNFIKSEIAQQSFSEIKPIENIKPKEDTKPTIIFDKDEQEKRSEHISNTLQYIEHLTEIIEELTKNFIAKKTINRKEKQELDDLLDLRDTALDSLNI